MTYVRGLLIFTLILFPALPLWATPQIQSWDTPNGARVLFVEAPELPMLDLRVVFNAGGARDAKPGVARLTNAMLVQGAGDWNADRIAERMEGVGAKLGNGSLRDMAWVSVRTLTREPAMETALDTLATILGDPTFPAADLERLRRSTLVALNQDRQQPRTVASKAWYRAVYGDHPYAEDPTGTIESVQELTQDDLLAHYRRYYVAKNAVVAIVGAVTREQAEHLASRVTAGLAPGEAAAPLPPVADLTGSRMERIDFPSSQSHIYVGQPGMTRTDPDYFPLYVGNHILGGNGLVSLLSEEVREKRGLSYSVYSYFLPMQERGPFLMGLQTKNEQAEQARRVMMETLARFRDQGPTEQELSDAKKNITGGFPLRIASNAKIVEYLAVIGFYGLPLDYLETLNAKVEAVTAEQIRDAFERRLDPERFATVVVGARKGAQVAASTASTARRMQLAIH
jgi:zinc protease